MGPLGWQIVSAIATVIATAVAVWFAGQTSNHRYQDKLDTRLDRLDTKLDSIRDAVSGQGERISRLEGPQPSQVNAGD